MTAPYGSDNSLQTRLVCLHHPQGLLATAHTVHRYHSGLLVNGEQPQIQRQCTTPLHNVELAETPSKVLTFEEHTSLREGERVWDAVAGSVQLGHDSLQAAMLLYELHGSYTTNACTKLPAMLYLFCLPSKHALVMLTTGTRMQLQQDGFSALKCQQTRSLSLKLAKSKECATGCVSSQRCCQPGMRPGTSMFSY